ncbi:MAG: hypothetical protein WC916_01885 [Candidatus Woesearchaeota archaeon]
MSKEINKGLEEYFEELENEKEGFGSYSLKKSQSQIESERLRANAREEFEKIKNKIVKNINRDMDRGGTLREPASMVFLKDIPYQSVGEGCATYKTKNLTEKIVIHYYHGSSIMDPDFIGLDYGLAIRPIKKRNNRTVNLIEEIKQSQPIAQIKNIYEITPSIQNINGKTVPKSIAIGLENPFWDEYSKITDTELHIEMRIIEHTGKEIELVNFFNQCHLQAIMLDCQLNNTTKIDYNNIKELKQ